MSILKIRFVTSSDPISAAIRAAEYGFWASHAEVLMPDGSLLGAHYDGGVQARVAGYDKATLMRESYVSLLVTETEESIFYNFLHAQLGKPYDLEAIVGIIAQRNWRAAEHWFCSELVAAALEHCGYLAMLAAEVQKITPRDLLLILSATSDLKE